jgi:hypothetical protein
MAVVLIGVMTGSSGGFVLFSSVGLHRRHKEYEGWSAA